ncbi:MAG: glycosyl transferase family 1 [Acidobacteria bacterium CG_4_9_14_3_um_filter_49_7]|nr:MAG: glycosyl transferase family 1 [Acidobacteria bacterium CG_4_9_14_3_um_filter_49_7]
MRVLMQSRKTLFSVPGGDTIQILKTKEYLEQFGVTVDLSLNLEPSLEGYDLVHLFNITRPQETWTQARNAKRQNVPFVFSTIYVDYSEYEKYARTGVPGFFTRHLPKRATEVFKILGRVALNREMHRGLLPLWKGMTKLVQEICSDATGILPNSASEFERLKNDFVLNVDEDRITIIPNGYDEEIFSDDFDSITVNEELLKSVRGSVLCVARIEGRKNQHNLIHAFRDLPYQLVLIGTPAPNHMRYYRSILKDLPRNVRVIGAVPHEQLPLIYRVARVHVLPSWMETTGLSTLEAAAMGCNIVVTRKGDTEEYFGDYAFYCEPDNVDSIRTAVQQAYETPVDPSFRKHVMENFTWKIAGRMTLSAYEKALRSQE